MLSLLPPETERFLKTLCASRLQAFRPRSFTAAMGFATTFLVIAVLLYCDRDVAPIFGHLSYYAGIQHR